MTFSYDDTIATNRDKVRFWLSDTVEDAGPLPESKNFSDAEIDGLLTEEGSWQRAVAGALERLAIEWFQHPSYSADNFNISNSHVGRNYATMAQEWRARYGYKKDPQGYHTPGTSKLTFILGHND